MRIFCLCIICSLFARCSAPSKLHNSQTNSSDFVYLPKWLLLEERLKLLFGGFAKTVRPYVEEISNSRSISPRCAQGTFRLLEGIGEMKEWAVRFLDSSAKAVDGILDTSVASFGRYDECIATVVMDDSSEQKIAMSGQYCLMEIKPHVPMDVKEYIFGQPTGQLRKFSMGNTALRVYARYSNAFMYGSILFGICVPSVCTLHDVNEFADYVGQQNGLIIKTSSCNVKQETEYTFTIIFILVCYGIVICMVIVGTLIEILMRNSNTSSKGSAARILLSFSVITNFKDIFSIHKAATELRCIHGLRVLCTLLLFPPHALNLRVMQIQHNIMSLKSVPQSLLGQMVINANIILETFFFISGFLIGYLEKRNKRKFSDYIISRLFRLYPSLIFANTLPFLSHLLVAGPVWNMVHSRFMKSCQDNWWTHLLFVGNLYNAERICLFHLWFISCEVQLYIITYFFLSVLKKNKTVGIGIAVTAIFMSMVCTGLLTYTKDQPPTMIVKLVADHEELIKYCKAIYFLPFIHMGSYLIGLLTGVYLANMKNLKISKVTLTFGWILAIILDISALFGALSWNRGEKIGLVEGILYASCCRVAWSLGIAWVVIVCVTGHGGVVNYILSWSVWIPMSSLSFVIYLLHPILQMFTYGYVSTVIPEQYIYHIRDFMADMMMSYLLSLVLYLLIESPFSKLRNNFILSEQGKKQE